MNIRERSKKLSSRLHSAASVLLIAGSLMPMALPVKAIAQVVITVTGTVSTGHDDYGIFKTGRILSGKDFTVTFTFDDANAQQTRHACIGETGIGLSGSSASAAGRGVLTIGNGSYVFGEKPDSVWGAFRSIPSTCTSGEIGFNVKEGVYPQTTLLRLRAYPADGAPAVTNSLDWHSSVSASNLNKNPMFSGFVICKPGDFEHSAQGVLIPKTITVTSGFGAH